MKMSPQDQQRLLVQLRKGDYGAGVAEHIARGTFQNTPGCLDLLNQVKQKGMVPAVHQALEFATELNRHGADGLAFEYKNPGGDLDLDVLVSRDGAVKTHEDVTYGCQLKDVQNEHGISSAARKIASKQLGGEIAGPKVAILDVQDNISALAEKTREDLEFYAKKTGATFEVRFRDGSVTVPPDGQIYP
ncbi:hypothetical protein [Streptomyces sp. MJP52]|uniref:hypothetical protein n=1 Tax=Streptomyces sp. MJP52 TaxID=2940555 RepID=UPI002473629F|nr:hypothetical protein [Streptomyces sp. MJP52]